MKNKLSSLFVSCVVSLSAMGININEVNSMESANEGMNTNFLINGNFDDSLNNWLTIGQGINPYHPEDPGRGNFTIENQKLEINIINSGNTIYSVMLYL
jgi:hypothetical protein